jgi:hypothetical protein
MAKKSPGVIVQERETVAKQPASFTKIRRRVISAYYQRGICADCQK